MQNYINLKTKLQFDKGRDIKYVQDKDIDKIEDININRELSKADRIIDFITKAKNPYMFIIDGIKVKFEYSDNKIGITDCMNSLIMNRIKN